MMWRWCSSFLVTYSAVWRRAGRRFDDIPMAQGEVQMVWSHLFFCRAVAVAREAALVQIAA